MRQYTVVVAVSNNETSAPTVRGPRQALRGGEGGLCEVSGTAMSPTPSAFSQHRRRDAQWAGTDLVHEVVAHDRRVAGEQGALAPRQHPFEVHQNAIEANLPGSSRPRGGGGRNQEMKAREPPQRTTKERSPEPQTLNAQPST